MPTVNRKTSKPKKSTRKPAKAAAPKMTTRAAIDPEAARTAFWHSPYTNADAAAAKKAFKLKTLDAAKAHIGEAVITRDERALAEQGITRARWDTHDCEVAFARSPYSDADAKKTLKKLPFLGTLKGARQYIGLKVVNDTERILEELGVTRSPFDRQDLLAAFKRGGYSAADVTQAKKKFGFLAGSSAEEVKTYLGLKVLNENTAMLKAAGITPGRDRHEIR